MTKEEFFNNRKTTWTKEYDELLLVVPKMKKKAIYEAIAKKNNVCASLVRNTVKGYNENKPILSEVK